MHTMTGTTQPAFVLTSDEDHGHRGHHNHHGISDKDQTVFSSVNASRDIRDSTHDLSRQMGGLSDHLCKSTYDTAVAIERNGRSAELATEKNGAANQLATNVAAGALGVAIQATAAATNLAIEKGIAATNLTTEKGIAATNLAIQVASSQGQLLAVQNAAAAALTAATNHAAILLEMCKCCCKTDELIRSEAGTTRELMRDLNLSDVRAELAKTQMGIAIANSKIATAPIVV